MLEEAFDGAPESLGPEIGAMYSLTTTNLRRLPEQFAAQLRFHAGARRISVRVFFRAPQNLPARDTEEHAIGLVRTQFCLGPQSCGAKCLLRAQRQVNR